MAEVSASKAISSTEVKTEQTVSKINTTDVVALKKDVPVATDPIKADDTDVFAPSKKIETESDKKQWYRDFINKTSDLSDVSKSSLPATTPKTSQQSFEFVSSVYSRITSPLNKMQEEVSKQRKEVTEIYDKLAAIYGEKEKDLKDRLSDTFKRLTQKLYNPLDAVDTSMEQKEHNKEKRLKDRESGGGQQEEKIKEFALLKKINYKLLEIKGEILNFTRKIKNSLNNRRKKLKKRLHHIIDELFEDEEENNSRKK